MIPIKYARFKMSTSKYGIDFSMNANQLDDYMKIYKITHIEERLM